LSPHRFLAARRGGGLGFGLLRTRNKRREKRYRLGGRRLSQGDQKRRSRGEEKNGRQRKIGFAEKKEKEGRSKRQVAVFAFRTWLSKRRGANNKGKERGTTMRSPTFKVNKRSKTARGATTTSPAYKKGGKLTTARFVPGRLSV